ncbi:MAG TPA: hypothetical protein VGQ09_07830 [Chitinophagaceae bacterium]|jgi:hypothetical protein|nr:hypothetical protein [Chitinophagaceae bacterium]
MNDPTLSNKTTTKRTDTSFFFFKGDYKNHSPFSFKADRTEIRLAEVEVNLGDSIPLIDTLLFYQLLGYSYGEGGTEAVKKEFSKFDRKYGKFFFSEGSEIRKGGENHWQDQKLFYSKELFFPDCGIVGEVGQVSKHIYNYASHKSNPEYHNVTNTA